MADLGRMEPKHSAFQAVTLNRVIYVLFFALLLAAAFALGTMWGARSVDARILIKDFQTLIGGTLVFLTAGAGVVATFRKIEIDQTAHQEKLEADRIAHEEKLAAEGLAQAAGREADRQATRQRMVQLAQTMIRRIGTVARRLAGTAEVLQSQGDLEAFVIHLDIFVLKLFPGAIERTEKVIDESWSLLPNLTPSAIDEFVNRTTLLTAIVDDARRMLDSAIHIHEKDQMTALDVRDIDYQSFRILAAMSKVDPEFTPLRSPPARPENFESFQQSLGRN